MIPIIVLSLMTGLCAGSALVYAFIKSWSAAAISLLGTLLNIGLLVYVLSLGR